ncbi:GNAT family N-acetyltransferase [Paludibacterium purpuratum]|uniref:Ribosomal protein S18 acetylase RimI-like enzyme n=1 Tax=Paludibacterium purpuratum TaxID=1144873 RepID=A0A4R7B4W3_9NEIS|nr:GNAT family N-acetyltransferase [Paludibacterium purpuratum]TDR77890.1 ribosomal protein S18 acetylase RimI-like enzyme [Paludibacterium purpuratum]
MTTMLNTAALLNHLTLRPARASDEPFLARLYRLARPDLLLIDGEDELIRTVQAQQYQVLLQGAGNGYDNAMHFVVERAGGAIGAAMVDFGHSEVRLIYFALLPETRGRGLGAEVIKGLQRAAWQVRAPLTTVVWHSNPGARRLYLRMGFQPVEQGAMADKLQWLPERDPAIG